MSKFELWFMISFLIHIGISYTFDLKLGNLSAMPRPWNTRQAIGFALAFVNFAVFVIAILVWQK